MLLFKASSLFACQRIPGNAEDDGDQVKGYGSQEIGQEAFQVEINLSVLTLLLFL